MKEQTERVRETVTSTSSASAASLTKATAATVSADNVMAAWAEETAKANGCDASTLCLSIPSLGIRLHQEGRQSETPLDTFAVIYGKQYKDVSYSQACFALGQAILHALSCDGMVDNRGISSDEDSLGCDTLRSVTLVKAVS